jgi:hypothetical protein
MKTRKPNRSRAQVHSRAARIVAYDPKVRQGELWHPSKSATKRGLQRKPPEPTADREV